MNSPRRIPIANHFDSEAVLSLDFSQNSSLHQAIAVFAGNGTTWFVCVNLEFQICVLKTLFL